MARRILRSSLLSVLILAVTFTAVMGFAHTKPGRPLLGLIFKTVGYKPAGCPLGYDVKQSADAKAAGRRRFAVSHQGTVKAPSRPALGFVLDQTTRGEILSWAVSHDIKCKMPRSMADLDCANVAAADLPAPDGGALITGLWLNFDANDVLVSVIAIRDAPSADVISANFKEFNQTVTAAAGKPSLQKGSASVDELKPLLNESIAEYRFSNYYAEATATNVGRQFALIEEYHSLVN